MNNIAEDRDRKIQRWAADNKLCWEALELYFAFSHIHVWNFKFKLKGPMNSVNPLLRYNAVEKQYEIGDLTRLFRLTGMNTGEFEKVRARQQFPALLFVPSNLTNIKLMITDGKPIALTSPTFARSAVLLYSRRNFSRRSAQEN